MLTFLHRLSPNSDILNANRPKQNDYFNQIIMVGKLSTAIQPVDNPKPWQKKIMFTITIITDAFLVFTASLYIYNLIEQWDGDVSKVTDILVNGPVYVFGCVLLIYYQCRSDNLKMMMQFGYDNFRYRSARGLTVFSIAPAIKAARIYVIILVVVSFISGYQWVVAGIISTAAGVRQLPLQIDYPVDSYASPYFEFIFAMQLYLQAIMAFQFANMSCVFITFATLVVGEFDILRCSIKNTGHTARLRLGVPYRKLKRPPGFQSAADGYYWGSDEEIDCWYDQFGKVEVYVRGREHDAQEEQNENSPDLEYDDIAVEDKIIEAIKHCVEHHEALRTLCIHMEDFFRFPFMINLTGLTQTLCTALFSAADHFAMKSIGYVSMCITYTLVICYMGNQIRLQSERIGEAVYSSGWERQSPRVRKYYLILMQQSARPVRMTSGGIMELNLDNFLAMMKMSFSFYTILRNTKLSKETHSN